MEMSIFFRDCPAPTIGITGTKGKTSTSALCAGMLAAWDARTVLAGNMGISAVEALPHITPDTPVVLELSSWQVEALDEHRLSPAIAVLTNISEDHLDTYCDFAEYAAVKRSIGAHQGAGDWLVVNADDAEAWVAAAASPAGIVAFGSGNRSEPGAWATVDQLLIRHHGHEIAVAIPDQPALAGGHQRLNIAAAAAAASLRGAPAWAIDVGLRSFSGVKDRMELVAEIAGVSYVNDTTATAPAATVAALARFEGRRVHLLAGGADKRSNLAPLVDAARRHAHMVYLLEGSATSALARLLDDAGVPVAGRFDSMEAAVRATEQATQPNDVVLLSPGCASFGLFRDEFDRGERFRQAVIARPHTPSR
jgi:UDP-N-acetylmuramoylalanine--D-glutamate ligase